MKNSTYFKKSILAIISFLSFLIIANSSALAGIEISPASFSLNIKAGEVSTSHFRVINSGNTTEDIKLTYSDWYREPGGKYYYIEGGTVERSIVAWTEIMPRTLHLEPGQYIDVTFTIAIPEKIKTDDSYIKPEGSYWGLILVEPMKQPSETQEGVGISIVFRYAIPIYVTIPDTGTASGTVVKLKSEIVDIQDNGKKKTMNIILDFKNTGSLFLKPRGYIKVSDIKGETLSTMQLYPDEITILPGETFRFIMPYKGPDLYPGDYLMLGVVDYGGKQPVGGQTRLSIKEVGK